MYFTKLTAIGLDLEGHYSGQHKIKCPWCSLSRKKKDEKCVSVNIDEGVYECKHCGKSGSVKGKIYELPAERKQTTSENVYNWFSARSIEKETVDKFKVTYSKEKFPQHNWEERPSIGYPYYLNGMLVNYKFKTRDKDFKMVKDAQKVPFNIDSVRDKDYFILVEGEEECMVWDQCGFSSVISCPNGATEKNNNLEWLDGVYSLLEGKKIYIATDNDNPGRKLRDDFARRFDPADVFIIEYPLKDANDTLLGHEAGIFKALFDGAKPVPMPEVIEASELLDIVKGYRDNGYPIGSKLGLRLTDNYLSWNRKEFQLLTGVPNMGKTTFLMYCMLRLSVLDGWKWAVFSPEHTPSLTAAKMCEQFLNKSISQMTEAELEYGFAFINNHFFFYNTDRLDSYSLSHLLGIAKSMVRRYGVDGIVFDPFTHIENDQDGDSNTDRIGRMLTKMSQFTRLHDVHITLVAHPRKMEKRGDEYEVPRPYDIAGSNNFFNTPDVCLCVHLNYATSITSLHVQKVKLNFRGTPGVVNFLHNRDTGTFWEEGAKDIPLSKIVDHKHTLL
jgi:twinkle protein